MPWSKFLKAHRDANAAADFFTEEVSTAVGLVRYLVFFVLDLSTRRVEIAGIAPAPHGLWMSQVARNLVDECDGFLKGKGYLIHREKATSAPRWRTTWSMITGSGAIKVSETD